MARAQARKSSASRSRAATRAVVSRAHAQSGRSSTYRGATCANKRRSTPVLDGLQARHELRRLEPPLPERRLDARLDELAELVVQRRVLVRELRVVAGGERGGGAPLEPRRVLAEGPRGLGLALVAVAAVAVVVLQQVLELVDDVDDQLDLFYFVLLCSAIGNAPSPRRRRRHPRRAGAASQRTKHAVLVEPGRHQNKSLQRLPCMIEPHLEP